MSWRDSAHIAKTALIASNVEFGQNAIVEELAIVGIRDRFNPQQNVLIGDNAFIGSRCTIYDGIKAGRGFDVSDQSTVFINNEFGDFCRIGPKAVIKNGCRFGNKVRVNAMVFMERVIVGSNVFIGPGTVFTDDPHPPCPRYADCVPETVLEDFVSIGASVTIAPGIRIGHHCQVYAGSVVTKNVAPHTVVAGAPARRIKGTDELECRPGFFKRPFTWGDSG